MGKVNYQDVSWRWSGKGLDALSPEQRAAAETTFDQYCRRAARALVAAGIDQQAGDVVFHVSGEGWDSAVEALDLIGAPAGSGKAARDTRSVLPGPALLREALQAARSGARPDETTRPRLIGAARSLCEALATEDGRRSALAAFVHEAQSQCAPKRACGVEALVPRAVPLPGATPDTKAEAAVREALERVEDSRRAFLRAYSSYDEHAVYAAANPDRTPVDFAPETLLMGRVAWRLVSAAAEARQAAAKAGFTLTRLGDTNPFVVKHAYDYAEGVFLPPAPTPDEPDAARRSWRNAMAAEARAVTEEDRAAMRGWLGRTGLVERLMERSASLLSVAATGQPEPSHPRAAPGFGERHKLDLEILRRGLLEHQELQADIATLSRGSAEAMSRQAVASSQRKALLAHVGNGKPSPEQKAALEALDQAAGAARGEQACAKEMMVDLRERDAVVMERMKAAWMRSFLFDPVARRVAAEVAPNLAAAVRREVGPALRQQWDGVLDFVARQPPEVRVALGRAEALSAAAASLDMGGAEGETGAAAAPREKRNPGFLRRMREAVNAFTVRVMRAVTTPEETWRSALPRLAEHVDEATAAVGRRRDAMVALLDRLAVRYGDSAADHPALAAMVQARALMADARAQDDPYAMADAKASLCRAAASLRQDVKTMVRIRSVWPEAAVFVETAASQQRQPLIAPIRALPSKTDKSARRNGALNPAEVMKAAEGTMLLGGGAPKPEKGGGFGPSMGM